MKFINERWNRIYKKFPELEEVIKKAEKNLTKQVTVDGSIRWDNWKLTPGFYPEERDLAIVFFENIKKTKVKIEFSPKILEKSKKERQHILAHELAHIELDHLKSLKEDEREEEKRKEERKKEKEAEKFAKEFVKSK